MDCKFWGIGLLLGIPYFVYIGPTCLKGVNHHDMFMSRLFRKKVSYEYAGKSYDMRWVGG